MPGKGWLLPAYLDFSATLDKAVMPAPIPLYEQESAVLKHKLLADNEALLAKIASHYGVPRDMSINVEDYPLEAHKRASQESPALACPKCGKPATHLVSAVPEVPLPADVDKVWGTMPAVVTRQRYFTYTLPCGCKVGSQWASAFGKEVNCRVRGFTGHPLPAEATPTDLAIDRKQTIDDLTELFRLRDDTTHPATLRCIEHALVLITARMMATAAKKGKTVAQQQKPAVGNVVAQWAAMHNLAHAINNPPKAPEAMPTSEWDNANAYGNAKLPQLGKTPQPVAASSKESWTDPAFPKSARVYLEGDHYVAELPGQVNRTFHTLNLAREYLLTLAHSHNTLSLQALHESVADKAKKIASAAVGYCHAKDTDAAIAAAQAIMAAKPVPAPGVHKPQFGSAPGTDSPKLVETPTPVPPDPKAQRDAFFGSFKRKKRRIQKEE